MDKQLLDTLDTDQQRALENVRAAVDRIWARPLHRYYTDHTVAHSERVIALLDGLTTGMMGTDKRLSPTEVFVLLAAAYLHDIGMQNERFAGGDLDEIRAHHNEQTAEMIYTVFEDPANAFDIPIARDPGIVEAVALVAKGHRRVDLDGVVYAPLVHGGETLRLRLLAALLRFGDELDIDHRRVDLEVMKLLELPVDSQLHWWKCHYVSGVSIVDEYIRIVYRLPQDRPDYESLIVPLVEGDVRAKHAALEGIFRANAVKVALGPSQIRLMRLLQRLPSEVETLARERSGGKVETVKTEPRPSQTRPAVPTSAVTAPNPFGDVGRITDPDRFFGREELLRQIFEDLGKGANMSLVGESQVGKSSLLFMVCALGPERMNLPPETFVYVSLQWVDDEDQFYETLCEALGIETSRGGALTRALRGRRHILCLDEIERMAWEGFTKRLRGHLRGLADGPAEPLRLVIASRSPLGDLFPDSPELDSPLANICPQKDVKPFTPKVAREFLTHRLRGTGVTFTENEIRTLLEETGGHPARLQRAAAVLFNRYRRETR